MCPEIKAMQAGLTEERADLAVTLSEA